MNSDGRQERQQRQERHGWHGIFTIPQTPFTDDGVVDEDGLRRQIDFCVDAGAHGIVYPVMVSEFWLLSDDERKRVVDVAVEQAAGRIPMIAGVAGVSTEVAVMFSRNAREAGADGAIALPPYVLKPGLDGLVDYYRRVADAVGNPVFIQNFDPPLGSSLSPAFIRKLLLDIPHVKYIKEEMMPCGHSVTALLETCGDELHGVFTGFGGRWFIDELNRGVSGTMPACEFTDVLVCLYERYRSGDVEGAREIHNRLLPLINIASLHGVVFCKEILKRRGLIASAYTRAPGRLDRHDFAEIDRLIRDVEALFVQ